MKQKFFMRLVAVASVLLLSAATASAHDFEVDGIYYDINSDGTSVSVTFKGSYFGSYFHEYSGAVTIPAKVTYREYTYSKTYSVTSIGDYAFWDCSLLFEVGIPNSVTSIGKGAFYGCSSLTGVKIPNSVTSIGEDAFYRCSGLTSVSIGNSVTSIGANAFEDCSKLKKVEISDLEAWCKISFYNGYANPTYYSHHLFLNGQEIKNLIIPESIQELKFAAFLGCSGLTSVVIPNSVKSISKSAFADCSGLTSVSIGNSVTEIGSYAFYECSGLTGVKIPNSVPSIGEMTFYNCGGLTWVSIGNSVTEIGKDAFYNCSGLKKVEISDLEAWCKISFYDVDANPIYYSHNLFLNKQEIKNLIIPESIQELKSYAFYGCSGLTSVKIPNSITSIGEDAFYRCSGLTSVSIGNSVTSIGNYAFYGCSGLESITVESGNSAYDSRDNCNALIKTATNELLLGCKNTIIPNSVTSIGNYAFYGCSGLTSVVIPNSVTSISDYAFWGCSGLTSVEIPSSVTSIGSYAFYKCSGLKLAFFNAKNCSIDNFGFSSSGLTLVIGADVEQIEGQLLSSNATKIVTQAAIPPVITSQTFSDKSCPLYVPKGPYAKYWINDIWDDFSDMRPIENPITKIELNKSSLNLGTNNITQLSATITPSNATLKDIYWVSDNPAIASVDQNGKVTWLKTGITTITAMAIDGSGVKATCTVSVATLFAENLTLNPSELTLAIYQSAKITPVITPDNATSTSLEWSTSNAGVAPFIANSDGSITVVGIADGVATITCRTTDGSDLTATCTVTVGTGAVDGIEADALTVRAVNGVIRVEGAEGARVEVFNTAGVCIYSGTDTEIYVPQRGLYVVKVAGRATKLAL